ncbi:uncharacterized protein LOC129609428 isoform X4 [Condylostylus longicornis]|uniref:uncharacterized protein LOC129609428 isoform X4 n=1 Tax=Condylostylus longicornis TaxID=2530218 RepID=UPI00244DB889|nr:uncharacterized protein LOC129609428 isoform X4 [Condylostylus longicornis]
MKSTFVIFILINLFLLTFTKSIAEEDDNAKYCKVKEHRNVKVKAGEHLVLPEKCQIIKCDEQGEKYTIEKSSSECDDNTLGQTYPIPTTEKPRVEEAMQMQIVVYKKDI